MTALICDSIILRDYCIPRLFFALSSSQSVTALICDSVVFDFSNTLLELSAYFESGSDRVNVRLGRT